MSATLLNLTMNKPTLITIAAEELLGGGVAKKKKSGPIFIIMHHFVHFTVTNTLNGLKKQSNIVRKTKRLFGN